MVITIVKHSRMLQFIKLDERPIQIEKFLKIKVYFNRSEEPQCLEN